MITRGQRTVGLAALTVLASLSGNALANGRFPRSLQLVEDPRDSSHLYLSGTYGLLRTNDGGANWRFVCESSFALNSLFVGDPLLAFTEDRSILVDVQTTTLAAPLRTMRK